MISEKFRVWVRVLQKCWVRVRVLQKCPVWVRVIAIRAVWFREFNLKLKLYPSNTNYCDSNPNSNYFARKFQTQTQTQTLPKIAVKLSGLDDAGVISLCLKIVYSMSYILFSWTVNCQLLKFLFSK